MARNLDEGYSAEADVENAAFTNEREQLLSSHRHVEYPTTDSGSCANAKSFPCKNADALSGPRFTLTHLLFSFTGGIILCFVTQLLMHGLKCPAQSRSSQAHYYPPPSPTNNFPELFPTNVGYAGSTPTGAEPALMATAPSQPLQTGAAELVAPSALPGENSKHNETKGEREFNLFRSWGNLSPWYSVPRGAFGIDEGPEPPEGCHITGVHVLHRHGARYPTGSSSGPAVVALHLHETAEEWEATGSLAFLNEWDRMHASAVNFALGFFGWPLDGMYEQVIMIEAQGHPMILVLMPMRKEKRTVQTPTSKSGQTFTLKMQ
ncbi:hypothetical protein ID866_9102 [Astraeus odoratus]|nr:hypothetical protein ID866_9102 [Astraeus odoratus]